MNYIFIGGAFFGANNEDLEIFPKLTKLLQKELNLPVYNPLDIENFRNEYKLKHVKASEEELNKAMVDYDLQLVKNCSLFIADVSNKSTGLGIELGVIKTQNCLVELIAKKDSKISNMVYGAFPNSKVSFYKNENELEQIIKEIAKKYKLVLK